MKSAIKFRQYRTSLAITAVALLAIYILLPQLHSFRTSLKTIMHADPSYIILAVFFFIVTYFAAALSYCLITYFRLPYWPTLLVQVAAGFTNRIAPAGLGAVTTNVLYLLKRSKSGVKAGYVAGLNNLIGFIAHVLLLAGLLIISKQSPRGLIHIKSIQLKWYLLVFLPPVVLLISLFWKVIKKFSIKSYGYLVSALAASLKRPWRLLAGLFAAMLVTVFYFLCLYAVMLALNVHLSLLQVFLVLTISVIAITVTPTPGGLGGVETGLVATLISFGVAAGPALSVALVYRLITFWLPILPGFLALQAAINQNYLLNSVKS